MHLLETNTPTSSDVNDKETIVHYIAAEIEFEIQNQKYAAKMKQQNIQYASTYANAKTERRWLREKIEENVKLVQFTLPEQNKPTLIHSTAAQNAAVGKTVNSSHPHDDLKNVFEASIGATQSY